MVVYAVTADLASSQTGHEYQLQRALTVVVPCAVVPLIIVLVMIFVRRCRRHQDQQQQHATNVAPVKSVNRMMSVSSAQQQQVAVNYVQKQVRMRVFLIFTQMHLFKTLCTNNLENFIL